MFHHFKIHDEAYRLKGTDRKARFDAAYPLIFVPRDDFQELKEVINPII